MKKLFVLLVGLFFLVGCATSKPPQQGILGDNYTKLEPGPEGAAKLRWAKPGVDFAKYNKVMVDPVSFAPAEGEANDISEIDPVQLKELGEKCTKAVTDAVSLKYPVVTEPGADVIRVRFGIIDLKKSYPVLSGVTSIMPIGLAVNLLKRPVTGTWTGGGSTVAQVLAKDSSSDEVIAAAQDSYEAGFWERFSRYGQAEDAFKQWGERLVKFLDEAKAGK